MTDSSTQAPPREESAQTNRAGAQARFEETLPLGEQLHALYAAGSGVLQSLQHFFGALGGLLRAEGQVLWAGIPLFFIGTVALIAVSVSLWACTVGLIFWALWVGTHSAGIALGIIVAGHAVLVAGLWFAIKRGVRQASFPQARAELHALRHQLAQDLQHFTHAQAQAGAAHAETDERP